MEDNGAVTAENATDILDDILRQGHYSRRSRAFNSDRLQKTYPEAAGDCGTTAVLMPTLNIIAEDKSILRSIRIWRLRRIRQNGPSLSVSAEQVQKNRLSVASGLPRMERSAVLKAGTRLRAPMERSI